MTRKKKSPRSATKLRTLDDLLKQDGKLEEFQTSVIKEVLTGQIAESKRKADPTRS